MSVTTEPAKETTPETGPASKDSIWTRPFHESVLDIWLGGAGLVASAFSALSLGERGYGAAGKLALASLAVLAFGLVRRATSN